MGEAVATRTLPAGLSSPTTRNLKESTARARVFYTNGVVSKRALHEAVTYHPTFAGEVANDRGNIVRLEGIDHLLGPDSASHSSAG